MKKVYQTPQMVIVPIKMRGILLSSGEKMRTVSGSWNEEDQQP